MLQLPLSNAYLAKQKTYLILGTNMALKAYGKRVIVEPMSAEEKQGGILIPEGAKKRPHKGYVVSTGPEAPGLKAGTVVYYASFAGTEVESGSKKLLVLSEEDILATE
jgi:chaperonin GroES